jgi:hypothetical protein
LVSDPHARLNPRRLQLSRFEIESKIGEQSPRGFAFEELKQVTFNIAWTGFNLHFPWVPSNQGAAVAWLVRCLARPSQQRRTHSSPPLSQYRRGSPRRRRSVRHARHTHQEAHARTRTRTRHLSTSVRQGGRSDGGGGGDSTCVDDTPQRTSPTPPSPPPAPPSRPRPTLPARHAPAHASRRRRRYRRRRCKKADES